MKSDRSKTCGVIKGSIQNIATRFRAAQGDNFGDTWETHCNNIRQVLCRLQQSILPLKLTKCSFFMFEVVYLEHVINGRAPGVSRLDNLLLQI